MIYHKLHEYVDVLAQLYGNGAYLRRHLAMTLTEDELLSVECVLQGKSLPELHRKTSALKLDSIRRANARLLEKLDTIVLLAAPSTKVPKRVSLTRDVFALVASASLAYRTDSELLAKHKFQVALRKAVLPSTYELRLYIVRMLVTIAANESNGTELQRCMKEFDRTLATYELIAKLDVLLRKLIFTNTKKYQHHARLRLVGQEALELLQAVDLRLADPAVVIAGCPLATSVSQILSDISIADNWLHALPNACIALDLWDDSHQSDYYLQQLGIGEYFGKGQRIQTYTRKLIKLTKVGSVNWFHLSRYIAERALRSSNYLLSAQVMLDAMLHPRFRKLRLDIRQAVILTAGYAAVVSGNHLLYLSYYRRRRLREASTLHCSIIDVLYAFKTFDILDTMVKCEYLVQIIEHNSQDQSDAQRIRKITLKCIRQLKRIEMTSSVRMQRSLYADLRDDVSAAILPLALNLL